MARGDFPGLSMLKGRANIMTMSWHTMMDFEPPIVGCVISNRDYTFSILKQTKECVINIPTVELAAKVVGCGNTSGRDVDKFKVFQLTPADASLVKAPLIDERYAISSARSSIRPWWPSTISSSCRSRKHGSPPQQNAHGQFIIWEKGCLWLPEGRSSWLPK